MMDIVQQIEAVEREVGTGRVPAGEGRAVRLRRTYEASLEDVWDALTDPDRIGRWFLPVTGDFRIGGHYQFEGNAGGEILACDRPNQLKATWIFGDAPTGTSEVEVRLTRSGDEATTLELDHTAIVPDEMWSEYGPGAVGVGWEGGLLGLSLHLQGGSINDPMAWAVSDEGRDFYKRSSQAWGEANGAAGADADTVARTVANTNTFYAPDPDAAT